MSSSRFIYFGVRRVDDMTVDVLTLAVVIGQGLADIIIFGLVEHRCVSCLAERG